VFTCTLICAVDVCGLGGQNVKILESKQLETISSFFFFLFFTRNTTANEAGYLHCVLALEPHL